MNQTRAIVGKIDPCVTDCSTSLRVVLLQQFTEVQMGPEKGRSVSPVESSTSQRR